MMACPFCPPIRSPLAAIRTGLSAEGGLRLWPGIWADRGGIDGFYMARLTRSEG
jgi:hypothetical protein